MAVEISKYTCPRCKKEYPWTASIAGRRIRCQCGNPVFVPKVRPTHDSAAPAAAPASVAATASAGAPAAPKTSPFQPAPARPPAQPAAPREPAGPRSPAPARPQPARAPARQTQPEPVARSREQSDDAEQSGRAPRPVYAGRVEARGDEPRDAEGRDGGETRDRIGGGDADPSEPQITFRDDGEEEQVEMTPEQAAEFDWDRSMYEIVPSKEEPVEIDPVTGRPKPRASELEALSVWAVKPRVPEENDDEDKTVGSKAKNLYVPLGLIVVGLAINYWAAFHYADARDRRSTILLRYGAGTGVTLLLVVGAGLGIIRALNLNFLPMGKTALKLAAIAVGADAIVNGLSFLAELTHVTTLTGVMGAIVAVAGTIAHILVGIILYFQLVRFLLGIKALRAFPITFVTWALSTFVGGLMTSQIVSMLK